MIFTILLIIIVFLVIFLDSYFIDHPISEKKESKKKLKRLYNSKREDNIPGPSPWYYFEDKKIKFSDFELTWKFISQYIPVLKNKKKETVLILGSYSYCQQIPNNKLIIWYTKNNEIKLYIIDAEKLSKIKKPYKDDYPFIVNHSSIIHEFQFNCLEPGEKIFEELKEFSYIGEIFVLAEYVPVKKNKTGMYQAVYVLNFTEGKIEVYPQNWFNDDESIDFGYQWITRVSRNRKGQIFGDGIRLMDFVLDETNMN